MESKYETQENKINAEEILREIYLIEGIEERTNQIIDKLPHNKQETFNYTHNLWYSKAKPVLPYLIGINNNSPVDKMRTIASTIDILWTLSVMIDDFEDRDEKRRGKSASWVRYGPEFTHKTAESCLHLVLNEIAEEIGIFAKDQCLHYITQGLISQHQHKNLSFHNTLEDILKIYTARDSFFTTYPLVVAEQLSVPLQPQNFQKGIFALQEYNKGGQIGNDLRDLSIENSIPRFSDLRNGVITIPIKIIWDNLTTKEQEWFIDLHTCENITTYDVKNLQCLMQERDVVPISIDLIERKYNNATRLLYTTITDYNLTIFMNLCQSQLAKFNQYF